MVKDRVKNSKYTFNINKEQKEKFKAYCKIMNVSPSDMLIEVIAEFNDNCDKIVNMKNISELQAMYHDKVKKGQKELDNLSEHPTFKS